MRSLRPLFRLLIPASVLLSASIMTGCGREGNPVVSGNERLALSLPFRATIPLLYYTGPPSSAERLLTVTRDGAIFSAVEVNPVTTVYRLDPSIAEPRDSRAARLLRVPARPRSDEELQPCRIRPGVYAVVEPSTGTMVGILIVYPDCRMEVITS